MGWLRSALGRLRTPKGEQPAPSPQQARPDPEWRAQGNAALGAGNLAEAARCYVQGIALDPDEQLLHLNLGYVLLEQGKPAAAAERLQQALALGGRAASFAHEAHFLLGRARMALGQHGEALAAFDAAARGQPGFVEPLEEAVHLLARLQRHDEAVSWAERLARARPSAGSTLLLAEQLTAAGRPEAALGPLDALCAAERGNVEASVRRFDALVSLRRFPEALAEAERTLALTGPHPGALANAAAALEKMGRFDEALERLDTALRIEPGHRGALVSRVAFLTQALRLPEAVASAQEALRQAPDDADLHWNLALAHLLRGDFEAGWREHEWRLRVPSLRHKVLQVDAPAWQGESLAGRTILLHGEQGFGDNVQFVRLVPRVAADAATVFLRVDPVLQSLFARMLPANCRLLAPQAPLPRPDCHAPLMSLPAILDLRPEAMSAGVPYLRTDAAAVRRWRERLAAEVGLKVGVAWSGNPAFGNDHLRSMSLATFSTLNAQGCRFVTVQPKFRDEDRVRLLQWKEVLNLGEGLRDFADTAALMEALDLVITTDTAVAHLAGALGKPVWILLAHTPDWRWMLDREDSPWYPSARLYRQPAPGDWASVLARVSRDLQALADRQAAARAPA